MVYIVSRLNRRLAKFLLSLINHDNLVVRNITRFKFDYPISTSAENYKYLLYKYKFFHLDFYLDIGNIIDKVQLASVDDNITHTML